MSALVAAFRDGWGRVLRAPAVWLGVFGVVLVTATLPGLVIRNSIAAGLGSSREAESMASGVNLEWWDQFSESATGLDRSFSPTIIGFGAPLDNLSRLLDGGSMPLAVSVIVAASLIVWVFLAGGILNRYARRRPTRVAAFFGACGVFFGRFIRLGLIGLAGYWLLFTYVHRWLFANLWDWATRDMTVERTQFVVNVALYAVFGLLLVAWNVLLDYAKIRAVVEDRRSMLGALVAACRFIIANPGRVAGLYLANGLCWVLVLALYAIAAPGAGSAGWTAWVGFAVGQVYILARIAVKLAFWASGTALLQQSMAHAAYTAAPEAVWPESPAAEAISSGAYRLTPRA